MPIWHDSAMRLSEHLSATNQSVASFAGKVGLSPSFMWRIVHGERQPSVPAAVRIIEATDGAVTLDDLIAVPQPTTPEAA